MVAFVSVLSPVGSTLRGLRVGSAARWCTPSGDEKAAENLGVLSQPESSGDDAMQTPRAACALHFSLWRRKPRNLGLGAMPFARPASVIKPGRYAPARTVVTAQFSCAGKTKPLCGTPANAGCPDPAHIGRVTPA